MKTQKIFDAIDLAEDARECYEHAVKKLQKNDGTVNMAKFMEVFGQFEDLMELVSDEYDHMDDSYFIEFSTSGRLVLGQGL